MGIDVLIRGSVMFLLPCLRFWRFAELENGDVLVVVVGAAARIEGAFCLRTVACPSRDIFPMGRKTGRNVERFMAGWELAFNSDRIGDEHMRLGFEISWNAESRAPC